MYEIYDRSDQSNLQDLALQIDNVCIFPSSPSPVLAVEPSEYGDENAESVVLGQQLDPLGKRILAAAKDLLAETNRITIKDLIEATGLGDAVLRRRMTHIVELHRLGCIPGSGRAPSYYYLLAESDRHETLKTIDAGFSDEQILEKIKQKEARLLEAISNLQAELDSLQQDKATLESAIAVRLKYSNK